MASLFTVRTLHDVVAHATGRCALPSPNIAVQLTSEPRLASPDDDHGALRCLLDLAASARLLALSIEGCGLRGVSFELFCAGLVRVGTSLTSLSVSGMALGAGELACLARAACHLGALASLSVSLCDVDDAGCEVLAAGCARAPVLTGLSLGLNRLTGCRPLGRLVAARLVDLSLSGNRLSAAAIGLLADAAHGSPLAALALVDCALTAEAAQHAARLLATAPALTSLLLASNAIGDSGARALGEALPACARLELLDLAENSLTGAIVEPFASHIRLGRAHGAPLMSLGLRGNALDAAAIAELIDAAAVLDGAAEPLRLDVTGNAIGNAEALSLLATAHRCAPALVLLCTADATSAGAAPVQLPPATPPRARRALDASWGAASAPDSDPPAKRLATTANDTAALLALWSSQQRVALDRLIAQPHYGSGPAAAAVAAAPAPVPWPPHYDASLVGAQASDRVQSFPSIDDHAYRHVLTPSPARRPPSKLRALAQHMPGAADTAGESIWCRDDDGRVRLRTDPLPAEVQLAATFPLSLTAIAGASDAPDNPAATPSSPLLRCAQSILASARAAYAEALSPSPNAMAASPNATAAAAAAAAASPMRWDATQRRHVALPHASDDSYAPPTPQRRPSVAWDDGAALSGARTAARPQPRHFHALSDAAAEPLSPWSASRSRRALRAFADDTLPPRTPAHAGAASPSASASSALANGESSGVGGGGSSGCDSSVGGERCDALERSECDGSTDSMRQTPDEASADSDVLVGADVPAILVRAATERDLRLAGAPAAGTSDEDALFAAEDSRTFSAVESAVESCSVPDTADASTASETVVAVQVPGGGPIGEAVRVRFAEGAKPRSWAARWLRLHGACLELFKKASARGAPLLSLALASVHVAVVDHALTRKKTIAVVRCTPRSEGVERWLADLPEPVMAAIVALAQAEADREKEKAERERADRERVERERAERERAERERAERERAERERAERERAERERADRERADRDRAERDKLERDKAEREKTEREKAEREKAEREKTEREKAERDQVGEQSARVVRGEASHTGAPATATAAPSAAAADVSSESSSSAPPSPLPPQPVRHTPGPATLFNYRLPRARAASEAPAPAGADGEPCSDDDSVVSDTAAATGARESASPLSTSDVRTAVSRNSTETPAKSPLTKFAAPLAFKRPSISSGSLASARARATGDSRLATLDPHAAAAAAATAAAAASASPGSASPSVTPATLALTPPATTTDSLAPLVANTSARDLRSPSAAPGTAAAGVAGAAAAGAAPATVLPGSVRRRASIAPTRADTAGAAGAAVLASDAALASVEWLSQVSAADLARLIELAKAREASFAAAETGDAAGRSGAAPKSFAISLVFSLEAGTVVVLRKRTLRKPLEMMAASLVEVRSHIARASDGTSRLTLSRGSGGESMTLYTQEPAALVHAVLDAFKQTFVGDPLSKSFLGRKCRVVHSMLQGSRSVMASLSRGALLDVRSVVAGGWLLAADARKTEYSVHASVLEAVSQ